MEPTIVELPGITEFIWRRPEIPVFDTYLTEGKWWMVLGCVWAVGLLYVVWLYAREAKTINPIWCILLGLMRLTVYALLGIGFMLPAERTKRARKIIPPEYAKVAILFDTSLSMNELRDDLPPEGGSLKDMKTRMDKLMDFLTDDKVKFFDRLDKFHTTVYRYSADVDEESWDLQKGSKIRSNTARADLAKKFREIDLNDSIQVADKNRMKKELEDSTWLTRDKEQLINILTPQRSPSLPAGWAASEPRSIEYVRQAAANKKLYDQRFFENSTIGESAMKVLQQERRQKLQGIVVFTDGRRTLGSLQAAYDVVAAAKDANVPIFVVGLGKELKKVSMEIVDLRVPQLIRPEDKFRVAVSVNGTEDMAREKFDLTLDIHRIKRDKNGDAIPQNLMLVKVDEKGIPLKSADGKDEPPIVLGPRIRLLATAQPGVKNWAKAAPIFEPGNPPNAQVEFELDAAEFAEAAGKVAEAKAARDKSVRLGLAPDPDAEFVFQARMVKDPREIAEDRDAEIQFLMGFARENQTDLTRAADTLQGELTLGKDVVKNLADLMKAAADKKGEAEFQRVLALLRKAAQKNLNDLIKQEGKLNAVQKRDATQLLGLLRGFHVSDPAGMRVQQKPLRVLLVASAASRDYQFLRTLLVREMDKGRAELSIWLQPIPGAEKRVGIVQDLTDPKRMLTDFPTKRVLKKGDDDPYMSLASYDVVVLFDPAIKDKDTGEMYMSKEQLKLLNEWVNKDGGGVVYVASDLFTEGLGKPLGDAVERDPLSETSLNNHPILYLRNMLPVVPNVGGRAADVTSDQARRLEFPQASSEMEFLRLDEDDPKAQWMKGWERFFNEVQDEDGKPLPVEKGAPPERGFFTYWPVKSIKQSALVLAAFDTNEYMLPGNRKQPFLVTNNWGEGKVLWIGTSEVWRLRMYRDAYHERFWTKLLADAGSKSATSVKRRITAVLPRRGQVGKTYTFEARFEDSNGDPLKRSVDPMPELEITLSRGVEPKAGDQVVILDGEYMGKKGVVKEVKLERDERTGAETRRLIVVVGIKELNPTIEPGTSARVDANKVEIDMPKRQFQPRLGTKAGADLDKKNDGWFKVVYQPTAPVRHTIKIRQGSDDSNVSIHTFDVDPAPPPDLENPAPDPETIFALASKPDLVFARVKDDAGGFRNELETELRRLNVRRPKAKVETPAVPPKPGVPAPAVGDDLRLAFDMDSAHLIPQCMKLQIEPPRIEQLPTKTKDLWDNSPLVPRDERSKLTWTIFEDPEDYRKDFILPWFLCVAVGLLSVEWLLRKLLRLA